MPGRRRLLDHLLVAPLHGAVALAQVDRVLVLVGQDLDFNVARVLEKLLHVHGRIVECSAGFRLGHLDRVDQCRFGVHHAHAAATAAAGGLDDDRVADGPRNALVGGGVIGQLALGAGHARHAGLDHGLLGRDLVTHRADVVGRRADELETALLHALGEVGVFAQETIAGVNRFGVGDLGRRDDRRHVEIAQRRWRGADAHGFLRQLDVLCVAVRFGIDHHGLDAELAAGALDPEGNFPPVCNQDLLEHGHSMMNSGWPYSTA